MKPKQLRIFHNHKLWHAELWEEQEPFHSDYTFESGFSRVTYQELEIELKKRNWINELKIKK